MRLFISALIVLAAIMVFVFLYYQNNELDITKYTVKSENINDAVKIVHLSDLHSKPFYKVITEVKKINPDIIMITGDYINDKGRRVNKMLEFGKSLIDIAPVYYITGNHERRLDNFYEIMQSLRDIGFNVLLDELAETNIRGTSLYVLGLDENQASFEDYKARKNGTFKYKDESKLIDELCSKDGFKVLLSHFPENFALVNEMDYKKYPFDLQLSGHAHGGQFILPFIGPILSPGQGLFPKYARGSFGQSPMMIVSRGLGNAEFPFRLFNHPEIVVINAVKGDNE